MSQEKKGGGGMSRGEKGGGEMGAVKCRYTLFSNFKFSSTILTFDFNFSGSFFASFEYSIISYDLCSS